MRVIYFWRICHLGHTAQDQLRSLKDCHLFFPAANRQEFSALVNAYLFNEWTFLLIGSGTWHFWFVLATTIFAKAELDRTIPVMGVGWFHYLRTCFGANLFTILTYIGLVLDLVMFSILRIIISCYIFLLLGLKMLTPW